MNAEVISRPDREGDRASFVRASSGVAASAMARLFQGAAWNTLAGVAAQGSSFLSCVVVARILGRDGFGKFTLVQSTVLALTSLASLGLGITATKYVSQFRTTDPERAARTLGLSSLVALAASVCFSLAVVVFAPELAASAGRSGDLVPDLRLSALYVCFITLNGYQAGALAGLESFHWIARISVIYGILSLPLTWALTCWMGLRGAVLAQGANALLLWLLYQHALSREGCRHDVTVRYRGAWRERSALVRFSVPATASGIIGSAAIWWCNMTLVRISGYPELAIFAAVSNIRLMILFVPTLITRVASPVLNSLLAAGDGAGYHRTFWRTVALNGAIALSLAAVFTLAGEWILRLFGKAFVAPRLLIGLLLCSVVIEVVACNLYQAIFTDGSLWWQVAVIIVWTGALIVSSRLAIPRWGSSGLALSYAIAWSCSAISYGTLALFRKGRT